MMVNSKSKTGKRKKGAPADFSSAKRFWGVILFVFGLFLLMSLVSFIGSEDNWLGPFFGKAFPRTCVYVFGKFTATVVSLCVVCWGLWLFLPGEHPKLFRAGIGFSLLSVLCPTALSLASSSNGTLSVADGALCGAGGRIGYFLVQSIVWPVFGKSHLVFPFIVLGFLLVSVLVALFGLRPSQFSFVKIPFAFIAGLWAKRSAVAPEPGECPAPKESEKAKKRDKEEEGKRKAEPPKPEWNSDYAQYTGPSKPFRGPAGFFGGDSPVEATAPAIIPESSFPRSILDDASCERGNVSEREIEEKERYLEENEKSLGALEIRALRDEIAHLRQVQQMNDWENNRRTRPSIQGIVERNGAAPEKTPGEPAAPVKKTEMPDFRTPSAEPVPAAESSLSENVPVTTYDDYRIPAVADILEVPPVQKPDYTASELDEISHQLEEQLENFKVKGKVLGISTGPMITRFEVEPGPGVKVSRFAALHEDLALALKAKSIRILAPIPGKALVGVEVPNRKLQTVYCRDIFESPLFVPKQDKLVIALGKDITGNPYTMDLCRAPHLLIAGQTGSGKSVCINTLMASLLFSKTPDELRMILVDPKVVELKLYEDIPHLLAPVVTQPDVAVSALKWACVEMDRRYEVLAKWKVRNLVGYNQKRREQLEEIRKAEEARADAIEKAAEAAGSSDSGREDKVESANDAMSPDASVLPVDVKPEEAEMPASSAEPMENLPYIVIVIDELADLMMVAGKDVEKYIARVAQKARAVGIHLVIATQRPSVNVITGLIKANLPARISFKVASQVDSRTVMDRAGAEKLLGRGDMLYRSGEDPEPTRVHGGFLSDEEVEKLANACANQNVRYNRLETFDIEDPSEAGDDAENGALSGKLDAKALDVARYGIERGSLSTSEVQRHFSVGFSRAGKIMDQLERLGVCGPKQGSKPRKMLVFDEQALFEKWPA